MSIRQHSHCPPSDVVLGVGRVVLFGVGYVDVTAQVLDAERGRSRPECWGR